MAEAVMNSAGSDECYCVDSMLLYVARSNSDAVCRLFRLHLHFHSSARAMQVAWFQGKRAEENVWRDGWFLDRRLSVVWILSGKLLGKITVPVVATTTHDSLHDDFGILGLKKNGEMRNEEVFNPI
jgi:hypothetical protein